MISVEKISRCSLLRLIHPLQIPLTGFVKMFPLHCLGKSEVVQLAMVALLAEGHLLVEDVPGIGKTLLARAIAKSLSCSFNRIQFTPDLLPSDLLGTSVYQQNTGAFVFQSGPIFSQIILADEINRSSPRTQSALLEAMSDRQVSIDGKTRPLGPSFLCARNPKPP